MVRDERGHGGLKVEWTNSDREGIEWSNIWYENANHVSTKRIALIGDSVTRGIRGKLNCILDGYVADLLATSAQLEDELLYRQIDLFERGGYTYDCVFLQLGAQHGLGKNRCAESINYRESFKIEYKKIVEYIQDRITENVIILSGTPSKKKENLMCFDLKRCEEIEERNSAFFEVATELSLEYLDLYTLLKKGQYEYKDYIHLQAEGVEALAYKCAMLLKNKM